VPSIVHAIRSSKEEIKVVCFKTGSGQFAKNSTNRAAALASRGKSLNHRT
jgi:hypothetical protein